MMKSVLIADDNALVRQGFCALFEGEPDFEVCGEAENGRQAIEQAQDLRPDLILLDLAMPVMNGLDAARALRQLMLEVPIIMYSALSDSFTQREARSADVSALVSKSENISVLLSCSARRAVWFMRLLLND
jgi:DNA-binding NarL/FixJ family response regulator